MRQHKSNGLCALARPNAGLSRVNFPNQFFAIPALTVTPPDYQIFHSSPSRTFTLLQPTHPTRAVGPGAGQTMPQLHFPVIPRYAGDVPDPRGGIRQVFRSKASYW